MLTDEMKEIALLVAGEMPCCCNHVEVSEGVCWSQSELLEFAERFLAALPKPEPSAALEALEDMDDFARMDCSVEPIGAYSVLKRFIMNATPQDTAAIEQLVVEACAKLVSRCQFSGSILAKQIRSGKWREFL